VNIERLHQSIGSRVPFLASKLSIVLLTGFTALAIDIRLPQCVQAQPTRKFSCERLDKVPTTVVKTMRGNIPMIRWVRAFSGKYNNVGHRCTEVSARLDRFNRQGKLKFIRTGNVNTYPVLCVDSGVTGNTCPNQSVLVTLPKGTDAARVLQQLLDLRARASGQIINLSGTQLVRYSNGDAYVSVDGLLGN
jgi:Circadian oscillating protein COP23